MPSKVETAVSKALQFNLVAEFTSYIKGRESIYSSLLLPVLFALFANVALNIFSNNRHADNKCPNNSKAKCKLIIGRSSGY